ncbi:MAG: DUF2281 domain-containing protein [Chitinophagales bacterium]|nr:DUF2281 domain-containing protein [Chitinophagales bacterium]
MKTDLIIKKIEKLPEAMLASISDYIDFLLEKAKQDASASSSQNRKLGIGKGLIKWIAPDFDAPLQDMKEYE